MRQDWKYLPLGEICDLLNGFAFKSNLYVKEGIRVIRIANVQKGYIEDNAPAFYPSDQEEVLSRYMLQEGDLLMSLTGNVGRVGILHKEMLPAALNQRVACIRLRKNDVLLKYLFHYFNSDYFEKMCIASSHGAAQLNMSTVWLAKHLVPVPPLAEQERIVALLDDQFAKIDQLRANADLQLRAAKDLFQSALKQLLTPKEGWVEKDLKSIGKTQTGCTPSMSHKEYYNEDYIPFIKPSEINYDGVGGINYDTQMLSKLGADNGRVFKANSIFMVCIGTIGKLGFSNKEVSCNQQINVLSPYDEYCAKFIYYTLLNPIFQNKVDVIARSAQATLPIISKGKWEKLTVLIPPLAEQERIAARLDEISEKVKALQANYDQTITLCNDLKQSLLKSIFA